MEDHEFYFDNTFAEDETTQDVYNASVGPAIDFVLNQGIVTCFAYGQTGSGKTYTMKGIQNEAIDSLFLGVQNISDKKLEFFVSFFEIYGGRLFDLLNNKNKLQVLDDKNGNVHVFGLEEVPAESPDIMRMIIDKANSIRTTHNTVTNETSSRSHAICNIIIKEVGKSEEYGKLSLVDLAGSERAQETQSNNRQRRQEGAEINKSLLALKECIRALDARKNGNENIHVPFRASKLTHVLRDSFVSKSGNSKIIMISCVSPSYYSSNHSINTLRYSDRLKEKTSMMAKINKKVHNEKNIKTKTAPNEDPTETNEGNSNDIESDINSNVFGVQDDILNDINFDDKINLGEENTEQFATPSKKDPAKIPEEIAGELDDLVYLKKTVSKEGKYISDEYIKYHQLADQIVLDEDEIINSHMSVIKMDAQFLTEESDLITKFKKIEAGPDDEDFKMEEYLGRLEEIIDKKIKMYSGLQNKLDIYKEHIKEEDEMRQKYPQLFIDASEI
ncbi:MAG: hypothetical protein MJ252_16495 [archaeon]|nr:hypothetical protein [archaeon]